MATTDLEVETLGARRRRLDRQLADLRRARGKATADGRTFNSGKITAVEVALAELDDAEAELARRDAQSSVASNKAQYEADLAAYEESRSRRLDATAEAEVACRELAARLRAVEDAVKVERELHDRIHTALKPGEFNYNPDLVEANFDNRLWAMMRVVLRAAIGKPRVGPLDLGPLPDDLGANDSWKDAEAKRGSVSAYFRRMAPVQ